MAMQTILIQSLDQTSPGAGGTGQSLHSAAAVLE